MIDPGRLIWKLHAERSRQIESYRFLFEIDSSVFISAPPRWPPLEGAPRTPTTIDRHA